MLLVLTICDIRAVGPGVWNGWKGQLLRTLYYETELLLAGGFSEVSRKERANSAAEALFNALSDWSQKDRKTYSKLHYQPYLLSVPLEDQVRHADFIRQADKNGQALATTVRTDSFHAITEITVLSPDHPRLLAVIAGACAAAGANIVDAQIFTTSDGRALDTIHVSREFQDDADELRRAGTIGRMIEDVCRAASGCQKSLLRVRRTARGARPSSFRRRSTSPTTYRTSSPSSKSNALTAPACFRKSPQCFLIFRSTSSQPASPPLAKR
ncbi:hypothetical protein AJ87_04235 [Rhizobium yanglingense]|nr:hypothetical protein AJ87_04235 [Rhizobium yanglingense]